MGACLQKNVHNSEQTTQVRQKKNSITSNSSKSTGITSLGEIIEQMQQAQRKTNEKKCRQARIKRELVYGKPWTENHNRGDSKVSTNTY